MQNSNGESAVMLSKPERSDTVDLSDSSLQVDISDALSERDKVKFTVHTKTSMREFKKPEFSVVRQHEEFIWLHDRYEENEEYAGYIIPPAPPRPDFESSREKLQKLGEGEGSMSADEFKKMKQELEAEYLATFKKTVAIHEIFLQRLVSHPVFKHDHNLHVFVEYEHDLSVRGKNKKEKIEDFWRSFTKSTDEIVLSSTQRDTDDFFEMEKHMLVALHEHLKDTTAKADKMTRAHKDVADAMLKVASQITQLCAMDSSALETDFQKFIDYLEKARKLESRVSSDEDLKLSDTFRYYVQETAAAKALLYRRMRSLADYEAANKALDKARAKHKDIQAAEYAQQKACENFQVISEKAKEDLMSLKVRRVETMKKSLVDVCDLGVKHAKRNIIPRVNPTNRMTEIRGYYAYHAPERDLMYDESDSSQGVVRNVRFNMMGQIDRKTYSPEMNGELPLDFSKRRRLDVPKIEVEPQPLTKLTNFSHEFLADRITPPLLHPVSPQTSVIGNDSSAIPLECRVRVRYSASQVPTPSPVQTPFPSRMSVPSDSFKREPSEAPWGGAYTPLPTLETSFTRMSKPPRSLVSSDVDFSTHFRNFTGSETEKKLREESRRRFEDFRRDMIEKMEHTRKSRAKSGRNKSLSERRDSLCYSSDDQRPLDDPSNPDPNCKDNEYFFRRQKNNEAAKKSRDLRRTREEENEIKVQFYEMENENLRNQLSLVLHQLALYQGPGSDSHGITRTMMSLPCLDRN